MPPPDAAPLLQVQGLCRSYRLRDGLFGHREVRAVEGLDRSLHAGETLSLVGESGSGKTTTANLVLGLDRASAGRILWQGMDLATMDARQRAAWRVQTNAVFQDPMGSLDATAAGARPALPA